MTWQVLLYPARLAVFSWPLRPPAAKWWNKEEEGVEEKWWRWRRRRKGRKSRRSISRVGILIPPFVSPVVLRTPPSLSASDKPQGKTIFLSTLKVKLHCSWLLGVHPNSIVHYRRLFFFLFNYRTECFTASNSIMASARYFFSTCWWCNFPPGAEEFSFGQHEASRSLTTS